MDGEAFTLWFLKENGECTLGDCQPDGCKNFPYTDQPERLFSLYSVLNAVSVCPAAYEIFEALKLIYDFDSNKRGKRRTYSLPESDSNFSFIAGYTSWGFPYGIEIEDDDADDICEEDLPF